MGNDWITRVSSVRREVDPQIFAALIKMEEHGWKLRRQGHKFYAYCPCPEPPHSKIRIDGTPKNPSNQAKRILREAAHCPEHPYD